MKKLILTFSLVSSAMVALADAQPLPKDAMTNDYVSVVVTDIAAHQRYPWNGKVDIDFEFSCDAAPAAKAFVQFKAEYQDANEQWVSVPMKTFDNIVLPFCTTAGTYRVTWDAAVDAPGLKVGAMKYSVTANMAKYMVANIMTGEISYLEDAPDPSAQDGGWTYEYKTTNMVFRLIQPGQFKFGQEWSYSHQARAYPETFTLTRPFYCSIFELTQFQYRKIFKDEAWGWQADEPTVPANRLNMCMLRNTTGSKDGSGCYASDANYLWSVSRSAVSPNSIIGKFRAKFGGDNGFDLPSEAEWEYVARAGANDSRSFSNGGYAKNGSAEGTAMAWGSNNLSLNDLAWYSYNSGDALHEVGLKQPTPWGIYDIHGNVSEHVLDNYHSENSYSARPAADRIDPVYVEEGVGYTLKGGSAIGAAYACDAGRDDVSIPNAYVSGGTASTRYSGARLVWRFPSAPAPAE